MEKLLDYFEPKNYQLTLNINKETEHIRGKVTITGTPKSSTIKLHAQDLKVSSVSINDEATPFQYKDGVVTLSQVSSTSDIAILVDFSLTLNRNMEGVYLSTYTHEGQTQKIVTTQFESHYARQCFPCVDEPAAKATFDLKIISHDPADTIISNMPTKREVVRDVPTFDLANATLDTQNTNQQKIVEFETTPKMSTYLLAFCVGHFHSKTAETQHGVKVTTYSALNQSPDLLDFPNQIAIEALDYYDDLFDMPYPLPKLDQIAIPDFEAGAMENWGLVTYRESCLLAGPATPQPMKEYIATVITHELSHQWFGNLVTMQWWDDLWLNESFASVMQYLSVDTLRPDWHIMEGFFTGDCYAALKRDSLPEVQAVHQPVHNPEEIATLFDGAIVYAKGAHLIFMLMRIMGREQFFAGVRDYFKKHQYNNTVGDDLWSALQPYADFNVKEFMNTWISQPGYPVITPTKKTNDTTAVNQHASSESTHQYPASSFTQKRFLIDGSTDDTVWPLPTVTDDMSGHYLINLSDGDFAKRIVDFDSLTLEQRLRLLIDREMLSRTELVPSVSLLELLPKFKAETSEPIWNIISTILIGLKNFARPGTKFHKPYQSYVYDLVSTQLARLGVEPKPDEPQSDTKLRQIIVDFALYSEHPDTIKQLAEYYDEDLIKINPEIRSEVIDAKFKSVKESLFEQFLGTYQATADPSIRMMLLDVLTDAKKPANTRHLLELLEQPEVVRPQDHIYLFADLLGNHKTSTATYDWCYNHWDYIRNLAGEKTLDDYLRVSAAHVRTKAEAKRFFDFFDKFAKEPALSRSVAVAHVDIEARLAWIASDTPAVHAYLLQCE